MNADRRQLLERLFDGELVGERARGAADDAEAVDYLRQLSLLRELALRHDPSTNAPPRRSVLVPRTSRRLIVATIVALAASVMLLAFLVPFGRRTDPKVASRGAAPVRTAAGANMAMGPEGHPRSPRPSLEVELYRWANDSSPDRDDAASVALAHVGSRRGRPASREILALELANAMPGSAFNFPRSISQRPPAPAGSNRKPGVMRRHRSSPAPRA